MEKGMGMRTHCGDTKSDDQTEGSGEVCTLEGLLFGANSLLWAIALLVWDRTWWWWWSACTSMLCCAVLQWQWCTRPQPLTCKIVSVSECSVSWYVADLCLLVACWCLNACVFGVPIVHCTRTGAFGGWNMAVDVPCLLLGLGFCWFCFCTLFHYSIVDVSTGFIFVCHLDQLRLSHRSNQLWVF